LSKIDPDNWRDLVVAHAAAGKDEFDVQVRGATITLSLGGEHDRKCGDCQLCCRLVPVAEIGKAAGVKCQHAKFAKGCAIYAHAPHSCRVWSCRWLVGQGTADLRRPDRAHYVIDVIPDYITVRNVGQPDQHMPVHQIWVDPKFPLAHRDPALRAFLALEAEEHGIGALVRYNSADGFALLAPAITGLPDWYEADSTNSKIEHTPEQIMQALGGGTP
jgi:hypothetical protein